MKFEPRQYQREYLNNLGDKPFLDAEVGTGKSLMALERAKLAGANKILIIAPAPLIHTEQWESEIEKFGYNFDEVIVKSYHFLQKMTKDTAMSLSDHYLIIDEVHKIKNSESKQGRGAYLLCYFNRAGRSFLSGTPLAKWHDAINYAKITGLVRNKTEFVRKYEDVVRYKGYPEVLGYRNTEELKRWWLSVSLKLRAEDCLDLPTKTTVRVKFKLPRAEYVNMVKTRVRADGEVLDSAPKLNWSLRAYCETAQRKIDWVAEKVESLPNCLIFCNTVASMDAISEKLTKSKISHGLWRGDRKDDFNKFDVMIVQYQAGGTGLNLQKFSTTIFMSPCYSYSDFAQAIGRTYRSGQDKKCVFYELEAVGMIDKSVYKNLDNKQDFNDNLYEEEN